MTTQNSCRHLTAKYIVLSGLLNGEIQHSYLNQPNLDYPTKISMGSTLAITCY